MKIRMPIILLVSLSWLFLCGCETGTYHTVKPGQTLYRISRTYEINEAYLARVNGISDPSQLKTGTRIFVPGAERVLPVQVVKSESKIKPAKIPQKKKVVSPATQQSKAKRPESGINKSQTTTTKATHVKKLQWPLRGEIIRSFSENAKAGRGRGMEIAARSGSAVTAAEAGKVIYSGDGVNGYAHLLILQHENDLFTVYGFNRKNLVEQGDFVSQGERIALSGVPPSGGTPRLHFEVRKGKLAVNPMLYLP